MLEIVRRTDAEPGFKVLPRRWTEQPKDSARVACGMAAEGVERTFSRMMRWRRLVGDYEARLDVPDSMIHVAMGSLLLRRVAHQ